LNHSRVAAISLWLCLACSASVVVAATPHGQSQGSSAQPVGNSGEGNRVIVRAIRVSEPMLMDGRLDEEVYRTNPPITDLFQLVPHEGAPVSERTEAWVMFDAENIYVAARCWDTAPPDKWVANDYRRDSYQMKQNDTFGLSLDTFNDQRNGFVFYTNPLGARVDYAVVDDATNFDWNPVWDAKPGRFDGGWTVEIQIPFKSLRYKSGHGQLWGIQLRRVIRRKNEWAYLARMPQTYTGPIGLTKVLYTAILTGLELPEANRNVELKPYGLARSTTDLTKTPNVVNDPHGDFGIDAKYGLTANMTADFTYNTDFAQVEVDEQQVNLTRFNLMFPEKREFFLEGRGLFDFAQGGGTGTSGTGSTVTTSIVPTLFFTRRIGLEDSGPVPVKVGGRLTGKANGFSIGALNIQTGDDPIGSVPGTNFTVLRLKRDVMRKSTIGAILTNRSHSLAAPGGSNQTFGVDSNFKFYDSLNAVGYYARTRTPGLEGRDQSYEAKVIYNADRYGATVDHLFVGEHFNPEVGFVQRENFHRTYADVRFSPRPRSSRLIRKVTFDGNLEYIVNGAGILETRHQVAMFSPEFQNGDQLTVTATRSFESLDAPFPISPNASVTIPVGSYPYSDVQVAYLLGVQHRVNGTVTVQRGHFYSGTISGLTVTTARVSITSRLSFDPGVTIDRIELREGAFTKKLLSTRIDYAFTARMFASGFLQYNSETRRFSSNIRYRWEYKPGSEVFLVYTDEHDTPSRLGYSSLRNRAVVLKINRLIRF
jgi:uncharacterized protein DUF5916